MTNNEQKSPFDFFKKSKQDDSVSANMAGVNSMPEQIAQQQQPMMNAQQQQPMMNAQQQQPMVNAQQPMVGGQTSGPVFNQVSSSLPNDVGFADMGDIGEDIVGGAETMSINTMIRKPLDKFTGNSGMLQRISLVTDKFVHGRIHWWEAEKKRFYCLGAKDISKIEPCCSLLGEPIEYYGFLVIVYTTNREGKIVSNDYVLQCLKLGLTKAQQFQSFNIRDEKFYPVDLLVKTTNEQYQNYEFQFVGEASWLQFKDIILAEAQRKWNLMEGILGNRMSKSAFLSLLNKTTH